MIGNEIKGLNVVDVDTEALSHEERTEALLQANPDGVGARGKRSHDWDENDVPATPTSVCPQ